jgi:tryptophanyl-tRNA synthetase
VANAIIETLSPVQEKYYKLLENKEYLDEVLKKGKEKAEIKANAKIKEIYTKLGLVN